MRARTGRRPRAVATALLAGVLAGCGGHTLPQIHSDADRLAVARRLHAEGDCAPALELLKTYIASAGGAADVDEAVYLLGDCHLRIKEWALAAGEFERLLRDYPESDSAGTAAFRLGEAYFGQARKPDFDQEYNRKALEQWESYLRAHPDHWLVPEARRRVLEGRSRLAQKLLGTGRLYLKMKLPKPAQVYFHRVLDEYPDTAVVPDAMLGLALADARGGKRAEAIAQLREIEARFPGTSVAEKAARERRGLERES
jgi:outer membrane protein assembly factor BamD